MRAWDADLCNTKCMLLCDVLSIQCQLPLCQSALLKWPTGTPNCWFSFAFSLHELRACVNGTLQRLEKLPIYISHNFLG